jgi:hypothetical protein
MRKTALVLSCVLATAVSAATWTSRAPLPAPRCAGGSGVAVVNGSILLVGEANDEYNLSAGSWSSNAPYPRPDGRTNLNSNGVLGSDVYFVGGTSVTSGFDVGTIDRYNATTDTWTLNVSSFLPNASAGTVGYGGAIYSFGGSFLGAASLAFRLTPPASTIFVLASVPTARVRPAVVELGGEFWVIAGTSGTPLTAVEVFDPLFGTWSAGPSLPIASTAHAAGVVGGDIHVLLDAGVYRLTGGTWTQVGPPPPQSGNYAAVFAGDELHAIGGCSNAHYALAISPVLADTTPPVIAAATPSPSVLATPNHKLVPVTVSVVASDDTDPAPAAHIAAVKSSEPDDGLGDGDTAGDIVITGPLSLQLRAERAGKGPGRTYTITVVVTDASGNSSSADAVVTVPRDQRK